MTLFSMFILICISYIFWERGKCSFDERQFEPIWKPSKKLSIWALKREIQELAGSANDYSQHRPCGCLQNEDRRLTTEDPKPKTLIVRCKLKILSFSCLSVFGFGSSVCGLRWADTPDQVEARESRFLPNLLPSLNSQATSFRKPLHLSRLRICKMIRAIFCQESYPCLERLMRIFSDQNDKVKEPLRQLAIAVAAPIPLFTLFCSFFYCLWPLFVSYISRLNKKYIFNNYSSSPNGLWVNSPFGLRPHGLLTQRP